MTTKTFKHMLTLEELTPTDLDELIRLAIDVKRHPDAYGTALAGKKVALLFEKASTRTRISFEVGVVELGGYPLFLSGSDLQIGRGEPITDTIRVMSRYVDALMIRTYAHETVETLATAGSIPIINGLTDTHHPCQVLADLLTIEETFGTRQGKVLTYIGDGNNMAHSLMLGGALSGMHIRVASPDGYTVDETIYNQAVALAETTGGSVTLYGDPAEATVGAHVVYTDVFASMGQEAEAETRLAHFASFQVDETLMASARDEAIFLHCLPAHRGEEVTADVMDGPQSLVFDQAENRLHAQKALMITLLA
ncbi:ornithine carbamoyltransferase [Exiguobacterium alkaliphilum]|uniref:Ornithine carbamoyltransferase n=1 Tax=Exiguobacterium alkaliphilum TaxID=1428684 RepID=A0ABT2KZR4_9BACL|nr:ornithine carbamoyltransferase [Exiguobacterium alkaliphilum]MCT4796103.1 ornithine carbamoyltransferase [Exiguobacterium alkaliphilum]